MYKRQAILKVLPPFVTPVGVFVDEHPDTMRELAKSLGIQTLQLHGDEHPDVIASLSEFTIIKSIKVNRDSFAATLTIWRDAIRQHHLTNLKALVLESSVTGQAGGTGVGNDWSTIRESQVANLWNDLPSMIVAGGLTPENVGKVVSQLKPYAVDVSSGVETEIGIKSEAKIAAFAKAVCGALED